MSATNSPEQWEDILSKANIKGANFIFENLSFDFGVYINLTGNKLKIDAVTFKNCIFSNTVTFIDFDKSRLSFLKCKFAGQSINNLEIIDSRIENLLITNSTFEADILARNSEFLDMLAIGERVEIRNVFFKDITAKSLVFNFKTRGLLNKTNYAVQSISVQAGCRIENFRTRDGSINSLDLFGNSVKDLSLVSTQIGELYVSSGHMDNLLVSSTPETASSFTPTTLKKVKIQNSIFNNRFEITRVNIDDLSINRVFNKGQVFRLSGINFDDSLYITDSDMTGAVINGCDLFDTSVLFNSSEFLGAKFSNVNWPEGHVCGHAVPETSPVYSMLVNQNRDVYRQLKHVSYAQGNKIDALVFYRNEMNEHYKLMKKKKESFPRSERFIVGLDKWASDFGLSYMKPLKKLIAFHSVLFFLLICFGDYQNLEINFLNPDARDTARGFGHFLKLINPAHRFPTDSSGIALIIDFVMRVISGFFIFHIVKGVRKYYRK